MSGPILEVFRNCTPETVAQQAQLERTIINLLVHFEQDHELPMSIGAGGLMNVLVTLLVWAGRTDQEIAEQLHAVIPAAIAEARALEAACDGKLN